MQRTVRIYNRSALLKAVVRLLVGGVLLLFWGCAPLPLPVSQPVARMPVSAQEAVAQFVQQHGGVYADTDLAEYVRQRGRSWAQRSQRPDLPWAFVVLDRSAADVYLFPRGQVFLTRGAITALRGWQQLEAVLRVAVAEASATPTATQRTFPVEQLAARAASQAGKKPAGTELFVDRLDQLKQMAPGYALYATGRRQEKAGDLAGAVRTYLQAATLAPEQPQILTGLGLVYLQLGDLPAARAHLNRAVRLQPDYYLSRMGWGYVFLQQKDFTEAIRQLKKSVALLPIVRNRYLLAESYAQDGQTAKALVLFRNVAADDRWGKLGHAAAGKVKDLEKSE